MPPTKQFRKPTSDDLRQAHGRTVPDLIAPNMKVLFCGINPGLYSGATGLHFARPGNRFWPALYAAGFTEQLLHPSERDELIEIAKRVNDVQLRSILVLAKTILATNPNLT